MSDGDGAVVCDESVLGLNNGRQRQQKKHQQFRGFHLLIRICFCAPPLLSATRVSASR
jgi:hypothetical protein